jgi:hypothetical protein
MRSALRGMLVSVGGTHAGAIEGRGWVRFLKAEISVRIQQRPSGFLYPTNP